MKKFILLALVLSSCAMTKWSSRTPWENDIRNPENQEYVDEIAFSYNIPSNRVTQEQFNERYIYQPITNKWSNVTTRHENIKIHSKL